ncbi:MAG TPA: MFS transporter [Opitutaceae bacterium]|jgi:MFS family permease|nr:MFS transporter [Opitutaceae bacterium]
MTFFRLTRLAAQTTPVSSLFASHPGFAVFWAARGASGLAYQMVGVAVGWQMYALTHSTFMLGLVGLAQFVPMVLCTLPAGHVADRHERRRVSALALLLQALAVGFLALGSRAGWLTSGMIFGAVALAGGARSFERPASQALLPALVPEAEFPRALALSAAIFQAAAIAGPALGGLIYGLGAFWVYAPAAALALLSAGAFVLIRVEGPERPRQPATLASLFSGIHYIRGQPVILGSISLDLFAVLLGGATALLPAFARDILKVGSWGLGALRAAPALGSLALSAWLARRPLQRHVGRKMFTAVILFGLATCVFGLSRSFALSFLALVVAGAADCVSVVVRSSLVQLQTPDAMRGRVSAVNSLFIGTSNQLGEFESGLTAAWWGIVPATVIGGLGTLAVAAIWMRLFPELARRDRLNAKAEA